LQRPIPVPEAALKALRNALQATPDELPAERLQASKIHLEGSTEVDLVVPVLAGGHAAFFYILRPTSDGYQLIFDSGGDSMTVLRTKSHGYRDLQIEGITMAGKNVRTLIYRFDGHKYVKTSEKTEHPNRLPSGEFTQSHAVTRLRFACKCLGSPVTGQMIFERSALDCITVSAPRPE
jgi:hypothetical protein